MKKINIIIVGDHNVEIGTHVTLYSLLNKSSYNFHDIYYLTKNFGLELKHKLFESLKSFKDRYKLHVIEFDDNIFLNYQGLHGNTFVYSKLALANLIDCKIALYIDIDVVVNIDICEFEEYIMLSEDYLIMANQEGTFETCLEKNLYLIQLHLNNQKYYNTGVMLVNLHKWRENALYEKFLKFASQHGNQLKTADQTVINGVINEELIGSLPDKFNLRIENVLSKNTYQDKIAILHFYGRPKPWDLFAEYIHPHYKIFKTVLNKTYFKNYKSVTYINAKSFKKFLKTYKSYIKVVFRIKT